MAEQVLLNTGIPAARKAGIQIMHVTWGISDTELDSIPPVIWRAFGATIAPPGPDGERVEDGTGKERMRAGSVGREMGIVQLEDGSSVDAGRMLMRGQWNTAIHIPLLREFERSQAMGLPDLQFHKNRISGFWGGSTPGVEYLKAEGFKTLLFTGVNTDQCVFSSLTDACNLGFDTVLLKDGCGTSSPDYATRMAEWNCRRTWGFVSSCQALKDGVDEIFRD